MSSVVTELKKQNKTNLFNSMLKHMVGGIESKEAFLSLVLKIFGSSLLATRSYALVFMSLLLHRVGVQEMLVQ